MVHYKEIWSMLRYHQWEQFCVTPTRNAIIPVVKEFYASLKDLIIRGYGKVIDDVIVRGEKVPISLTKICEFYNISYYEEDFVDSLDLDKFKNINMEDVVKFLTQGRGSWSYRPYNGLPTNFNQVIMFSIAKMWMQFIGIRIAPTLNVSIAPTLNVSNINIFRVVLLYGILQGK